MSTSGASPQEQGAWLCLGVRVVYAAMMAACDRPSVAEWSLAAASARPAAGAGYGTEQLEADVALFAGADLAPSVALLSRVLSREGALLLVGELYRVTFGQRCDTEASHEVVADVAELLGLGEDDVHALVEQVAEPGSVRP